ncbi:hypothetical protein C4N9_20840 [Pararhodobacter marinus]|uniref:Uncharacterized protein n=1 Tax=Pararhodobacter marinus TaxID=2184063 RepID=A0A2U2C495_9RHOB|nr:hypothetical protein [Pararhodobacter marinus]PWE26710.1 hypothetical protein C4N9_20840 [Pararhodobacter marinus]
MTEHYRIKWARVTVCNRYGCWKERRCIAQRRVSILGFIRFWWPLEDGDWRIDESRCYADIENDMAVRAPLPEPQRVRPEA